MRFAAVAMALTLAAVPAFAGHGHTPPKPASEQPVRASGPKEGSQKNSHDRLGYEKSPYEKRLHASEREYEQAKGNKLKGLIRPADALGGSSDKATVSKAGEGGDAADSKPRGGELKTEK